MQHATDTVPIPPGTTAQIDRKIRPLIETLWKLGYRTTYCCEGREPNPHGGKGQIAGQQAYISFPSSIEATLFVALAGPASWTEQQRHDERKASERISKAWARDSPDAEKSAEWYRVHVHSYWAIEGSVIVRFPASDIGRAVAALRRTRYHVVDLIGTHKIEQDANRLAPKRCHVCNSLVISRRKDAIYCSIRCRLRARDRSSR